MGIRVSPHEVELVLLASRMVEQVVVLGVHHDVMGHAIHAVIVSRNVSEFDLRELKKYARNNLPQHLLPRHYEVVNELPLTANGKPDLVLLERRILENGTAAVADW
jgi:long-chain acyl-CoA synthetase